MKHFCSFLIALLCALLLTSCCKVGCFKVTAACRAGDCFNTNDDMVEETWLRQVDRSPNKWVNNADSWFMNGRPNSIEVANYKGPLDDAMTTMKVRVPHFENIHTNGNYQIQIIGQQARESVFILGANNAARMVSVQVHNNTLFIHEGPQCDKGVCKTTLSKVIVRIGVHKLRGISNIGDGDIYGRDIVSKNLTIFSSGNGNTMIGGRINLTRVTETGPNKGNVTVLGAFAPSTVIYMNGEGSLNISGRVGVQSIVHNGNGDLNIIGVDSDNLSIFACGSGKTALSGFANLRQVTASDHARVFMFWVNSQNTDVTVHDQARVGLAGSTGTLNVNADGESCFQGAYLQAGTVYVRTNHSAHANVATRRKLFAEAKESSTIYYFGSPDYVDAFPSVKGQILPITPRPSLLSSMPRRPQSVPWNDPRGFTAEDP